jgi:polyhydroxybutyrate depolymerase
MQSLRILIAAAAIAALSGCLVARVPALIEAHEAAERFPAKGDWKQAQHRKIVSSGLTREYALLKPAVPRGPVPIVLLLHGGTQTNEDVWTQTSLPTLAQQEGFLLAAPQGIDKHWNDGRGSTIAGDAASTANDVRLLRDIVTQLVLEDGGDARAVFVIGASNGGFMAMHFACEAGDVLRAGANVISNLPAAQAQRCTSKKPLPWMSMNGVKDPIIPFAGQPEGTVKKGQPQPALLSADATFAFWAGRAGCSTEVKTRRIGENVELRERAGCTGGTESLQYVFLNSGHVWPGLAITRPLISMTLGGDNLDVDTGQAAWSFFRSTL